MADNAGIGGVLGADVHTPLVICEAFLVGERLLAGAAGHCVLPHVSREVASNSKGLLTGVAAVAPRFAGCVGPQVVIKLVFMTEARWTDAAPERSLTCVAQHVIDQVLLCRQAFVADAADEGIGFTSVSSFVNIEAVHLREAFMTKATVEVVCFNGVPPPVFD